MKRTATNRNFILIRICLIVFLVLLAVYIPLKIYISRTEQKWPEQARAGFKLYVTRSFFCRGAEASRGVEGIDSLSRSVSRERKAGEPLLLIETEGVFCEGGGPGILTDSGFAKKARGAGYDAVFTGQPVGPEDEETLLHALAESPGRRALLSPSNVIPSPMTGIALIRRTVRKLRLSDTATGEKLVAKAGIFGVIFADSVYERKDKNGRYDIINPKIAALEAASALKEEGCRFIIAICGGGKEESVDLAETVPGIDLVINASSASEGTSLVKVNRCLVAHIGGEGRIIVKLSVLLEKDSFEVTIDETGI